MVQKQTTEKRLSESLPGNLSSVLGAVMGLKHRAQQESIHTWSVKQQGPATSEHCSQAMPGSYLDAVWPRDCLSFKSVFSEV